MALTSGCGVLGLDDRKPKWVGDWEREVDGSMHTRQYRITQDSIWWSEVEFTDRAIYCEDLTGAFVDYNSDENILRYERRGEVQSLYIEHTENGLVAESPLADRELYKSALLKKSELTCE